MRDWVKAIPVGMVVPVVIGFATVPPEAASSNIGLWVETIGIRAEWLTSQGADDWIVAIVLIAAISYAAWVFRAKPRDQQERGGERTGTTNGASVIIRGGDGYSGGDGGAVSLRAGDGGSRGPGGDLIIRGGDAPGGASAGGPDWTIRDLVFHVDPDILAHHEQDKFHQSLQQIVDRFSTGQLKCWGRAISGSRRLPLAPIDPSHWQHLKLISWLLDDEAGGGQVLQADRVKHSSPVPQYTGLEVNRAQALSLWPAKTIGRDTWLYDAIRYAKTRKWPNVETESDDEALGGALSAEEMFDEVMQAAIDGKLTIWGKGTASAALHQKLPPDYWHNFRIDEFGFCHGREQTSSEVRSGWRLPPDPGLMRELMTSKAQVEAIWPPKRS